MPATRKTPHRERNLPEVVRIPAHETDNCAADPVPFLRRAHDPLPALIPDHSDPDANADTETSDAEISDAAHESEIPAHKPKIPAPAPPEHTATLPNSRTVHPANTPTPRRRTHKESSSSRRALALRSPEQIPRPRAEMLGRLALQAYEVLEGTRSLAQLGNLVSYELSQHLAELRAARQEQQQVYRDRRYAIAQCGSIRACQVKPGVVEATVILHTSRRSHAVAIRLEWAHQRWRASYLAVL